MSFFLLVKRSLDAIVALVHVNAGEWMVVADSVVKSGSIRVVMVYAPDHQTKSVSYFRQLESLLMNPARLVLMRDSKCHSGPQARKGMET